MAGLESGKQPEECADLLALPSRQLNQELKMKTRHEYGNKPEGYSENEEEIAEDVTFKKDNKNAKDAFLIDQQHEVAPGNATSGSVQAELSIDGELNTDFIERRNAAITDRRNTVTINQRIDASQ
jgi:hypothetical protein